jgi:hypothetical protein
MLFILRRFFHKAVATSESDTASDEKLPLFEDSEKAKHVIGYAPSPPSKSWTKHKKLPLVIKLLFLIFAFAFTLLSGQSIINYATLGYNAFLRSSKAYYHVACSQKVSVDEPISIAAPPIAALPVGAKLLDRNGWEPKCSSSSKDKAHDCGLAIDSEGDLTYWQSANVTPGDVHWIVIDLKKKSNVHSLAVTPGPKSIGGSVRKHRVEVATEKGIWDLVALGTWRDSGGGKHISIQYWRHESREY